MTRPIWRTGVVALAAATIVMSSAVAASGKPGASKGKPGATTTTTSTTTIGTVTPLLADGFEALPLGLGWLDGSLHGSWLSDYNGYGSNGIETDGTKVLSMSPKASTTPGETHGALVTSVASFGDIDLTLRMKTVRQLRSPSPNPWETAWVVWNYEREGRFTYLALKPNGWELGKSDNSPLDPAGPTCTWPSYENCKYPGAQRFLATGSSPTFPVGPWHTVRVRQVGNAVDLWANGAVLTRFVDGENVYRSGKVGLYTEDAHVRFDDLLVMPPVA